MITFDDPVLIAGMQSESPPDMLVDYLQDAGCDLGNLLALFTGKPPRWDHRAGQGLLCRWLEVVERDRTVRRTKKGPIRPAYAVVAAMAPRTPKPPEGAWRDRFNRGYDNFGEVSADRKASAVFVGYHEAEPDGWGMRPASPHSLALDCPACQENKTPVARIGTVPLLSQDCYGRPGHILAGACPTCDTLFWVATDVRPEMIPFKRRILALFPDVMCPVLWADKVRFVKAPDLISPGEEERLRWLR